MAAMVSVTLLWLHLCACIHLCLPYELHAMTWNIGNAMRDAQQPDFAFGIRVAGILEKMKEIKADLMCIQEIRRFKDTNGARVSPFELMSMMRRETGLEYKYSAVNADRDGFYRATFFNPGKLFPIEERSVWMGDDSTIPSGPRWGYLAFKTRFIVLEGADFQQGRFLAGAVITVWNCHLPVRYDLRIEYMERLIREITRDDEQMVILAGDFNEIPHSDEDGKASASPLALLRDAGFLDLTEKIEQTFYSFPHDADKEGNRFKSKLDFVFTNLPILFPIAKVVVEDLSTSLLSDHWPITFEISGEIRISYPPGYTCIDCIPIEGFVMTAGEQKIGGTMAFK